MILGEVQYCTDVRALNHRVIHANRGVILSVTDYYMPSSFNFLGSFDRENLVKAKEGTSCLTV